MPCLRVVRLGQNSKPTPTGNHLNEIIGSDQVSFTTYCFNIPTCWLRNTYMYHVCVVGEAISPFRFQRQELSICALIIHSGASLAPRRRTPEGHQFRGITAITKLDQQPYRLEVYSQHFTISFTGKRQHTKSRSAKYQQCRLQ